MNTGYDDNIVQSVLDKLFKISLLYIRTWRNRELYEKITLYKIREVVEKNTAIDF